MLFVTLRSLCVVFAVVGLEIKGYIITVVCEHSSQSDSEDLPCPVLVDLCLYFTSLVDVVLDLK